MTSALEWAGALPGLLGAYLIATHGRFARYGSVAFLAANAAMAGFAAATAAYGLLLQQVGFSGTALLGLRRSTLTRHRPVLAVRARAPRTRGRAQALDPQPDGTYLHQPALCAASEKSEIRAYNPSTPPCRLATILTARMI